MGVLSTVAADGKPWGSAIYFVVDEDFNIFFVTRMETFKYQNLEDSPYAALTVADADEQTTVQLAGKVSRLPAGEYMELYKKFTAMQPDDISNWAPPIMKIHKGDYMPLQLKPTKLQYANFKQTSTDLDHKYIEKII